MENKNEIYEIKYNFYTESNESSEVKKHNENTDKDNLFKNLKII